MRKQVAGNTLTYFPILADLQEATDLNLCRSPKIDDLSAIIVSKHFDSEQLQAIRSWRFGSCSLKI